MFLEGQEGNNSVKYGCSFVGKLSWKKIFFWKNVFFTKYTLFAEKMFLYEKKFYIEKLFLTDKNINENVKNIYLSFEKYIFMQKMFALQIKYKSLLNIYSFCKKNVLITKNIIVKTSL